MASRWTSSTSSRAGFLADAVRLLPDIDSGLRAAVLARLSIASAATASADQRASLAEQAAAMARRVGNTEAEVAALAAFCDARSGPAYVHERIEAAGRMLALADHHALLELLGRRIRLRARLELGDLTGVDADIAAYTRVADRLRSPTYSWLVPLWRGMRAVLDGDLDAGSRYSEEVATLAGKAQSANADDDGLVAALENRAPAPGHPYYAGAGWADGGVGRELPRVGAALSRCSSPNRENPSGDDDICAG